MNSDQQVIEQRRPIHDDADYGPEVSLATRLELEQAHLQHS